MLLFGGHETTRNLIGNGLYTLLRHPARAADLREHPELMRSAVEELLRYESPVQYTGRMVLEDFEFCGVQARRGQEIIFMLGAANRDARQFKDPDHLDLKRANNPDLAFGAGTHFCIGNQLARLEGQVAILRILQEFPEMRRVSAEPTVLRLRRYLREICGDQACSSWPSPFVRLLSAGGRRGEPSDARRVSCWRTRSLANLPLCADSLN